MEHTEETFETLFETPVEFLEKSIEEGSQGKRCVKGVMSTEREDHDGESILQKGLDCSYLMESGYINYDHQRRIVAGAKVPIIIGYPTELERLEKSTILAGELLQGDPMASEQMRLANEMWELGMALQKAGGARRLAFSVEGPKPERRGNKIVRARVHHVALTHKPVNADCSVELFAKSLCCGRCNPDSAEFNPAHVCCSGNKHYEFQDGLPHLMAVMEKALATTNSGPVTMPRTSPLMKENLDRGLTTVLYGDTPCTTHFDPNGRFHKGIAGAYNHMTGCLGYSGDETRKLLKALITGAKKNHELAALIRAAGFVR